MGHQVLDLAVTVVLTIAVKAIVLSLVQRDVLDITVCVAVAEIIVIHVSITVPVALEDVRVVVILVKVNVLAALEVVLVVPVHVTPVVLVPPIQVETILHFIS